MALLSLCEWGPLESKRIIHHRETQSTNSDAFLEASKGASTGTWIIADLQTAGKGRSNHNWISQKGNLHASVILNDLHPVRKIPELSLVAGVAFHHAVLENAQNLPPTHLELKWPNDILLCRKKVGGVLIESSFKNAHECFTVVGFGLNLVSHPEVPEQKTTCLRDYGIILKPIEFLKCLDHNFHYWLAIWSEDEGLTRIKNEWTACSLPTGTVIKTKGPSGPLIGIILGINEDGFLIIKTNDDLVETVSFGDIRVHS